MDVQTTAQHLAFWHLGEVDIVFRIKSISFLFRVNTLAQLEVTYFLGLCEFDNTKSLLKHKVSESEERVQGGLPLPLLPTLNSVKPGGGDQDRVILALMIEVETEIPRGRELALPVTHGGAVEGEGVDVPDVGLGGPLLVQPGDNDDDGCGGGHGGGGGGRIGGHGGDNGGNVHGAGTT